MVRSDGMTCGEYLKSIGASAEDIKAMTEGSFAAAGQKAFEKMMADADAARAEGLAAKEAAKKDRDQLTGWFNETAVPEFKEMERRSLAAEAEAGKARAAWKAAQERGLVDLEQLKALGYDTTPPVVKTPTGLPEGFDPSQFVTRNDIKGVADNAGDGLAVLQDIVMEHA